MRLGRLLRSAALRWLTLVVLTLSAIGSFDARAIAAAQTIKITAVTVKDVKDATPTPHELKRCFGTGAERDRCLGGARRTITIRATGSTPVIVPIAT